MAMLLAFAPFILFAVVMGFAGVTAGLSAAALAALALLARESLLRGRSFKILELGSAILFTLMAAHALLAENSWPLYGVRLGVDGGLLAIVLISIAIRRPFTLQYAREQVPREWWERPGFLRVNYHITAAWGLAFAAMVASDLAALIWPGLPTSLGTLVTVAALIGAWRFSTWYPQRARARAATAGLF